MFDFGTRFIELRVKLNLKQGEYAKLLGIGYEHLSRIENNKGNPSFPMVFKVCQISSITIEEFFNPTLGLDGSKDLVRLLNSAKKLNVKQLSSLNEFIESLN